MYQFAKIAVGISPELFLSRRLMRPESWPSYLVEMFEPSRSTVLMSSVDCSPSAIFGPVKDGLPTSLRLERAEPRRLSSFVLAQPGCG